MPDWDANSPRLAENLTRILREARDHARSRQPPTCEQARRWHTEMMSGLDVPSPGHASWIGRFRGEPGQVDIGARIGSAWGAAPGDVDAELIRFQSRLQAAVHFLDARLPSGEVPTGEALGLVLELMSWVHTEWVRIHPFANGNGRIARVWANWAAMRYAIPPFVRLRPRPAGLPYADAAMAAMRGDYRAMIPVFRQMLEESIRSGN